MKTLTDDKLRELLKSAYLAGFAASGEGYNAEYPFGCTEHSPTENKSWCVVRDRFVNITVDALDDSKPAPAKGKSAEQIDDIIEQIDDIIELISTDAYINAAERARVQPSPFYYQRRDQLRQRLRDSTQGE